MTQKSRKLTTREVKYQKWRAEQDAWATIQSKLMDDYKVASDTALKKGDIIGTLQTATSGSMHQRIQDYRDANARVNCVRQLLLNAEEAQRAGMNPLVWKLTFGGQS